ALGEVEVLDRRAAARGLARALLLERTEDVRGEVEDLLRGAVAEAQRLDADVVEAELGEHRAPVGEAVLHMETLRDVTREGDRPTLRGGAEDDLEFGGAEILRLVDEDVLVGERLPAAPEGADDELVETEEERVVFDVELGRLVFFLDAVDRAILALGGLLFLAFALVGERLAVRERRAAPAVAMRERPLELALGEVLGRVLGE